MGVEAVVEVSPTQFDSKSLLVWMGGWMVDKTKIMQCHLLNEVVVEDASSIQELVIPSHLESK